MVCLTNVKHFYGEISLQFQPGIGHPHLGRGTLGNGKNYPRFLNEQRLCSGATAQPEPSQQTSCVEHLLTQ